MEIRKGRHWSYSSLFDSMINLNRSRKGIMSLLWLDKPKYQIFKTTSFRPNIKKILTYLSRLKFIWIFKHDSMIFFFISNRQNLRTEWKGIIQRRLLSRRHQRWQSTRNIYSIIVIIRAKKSTYKNCEFSFIVKQFNMTEWKYPITNFISNLTNNQIIFYQVAIIKFS